MEQQEEEEVADVLRELDQVLKVGLGWGCLGWWCDSRRPSAIRTHHDC